MVVKGSGNVLRHEEEKTLTVTTSIVLSMTEASAVSEIQTYRDNCFCVCVCVCVCLLARFVARFDGWKVKCDATMATIKAGH